MGRQRAGPKHLLLLEYHPAARPITAISPSSQNNLPLTSDAAKRCLPTLVRSSFSPVPWNSIWRFSLALHHLLTLARAVTCLPSLALPFSCLFSVRAGPLNPSVPIFHSLASIFPTSSLFRACYHKSYFFYWRIMTEYRIRRSPFPDHPVCVRGTSRWL